MIHSDNHALLPVSMPFPQAMISLLLFPGIFYLFIEYINNKFI